MTTAAVPFGDLEVLHDGRIIRPRAWTVLQSHWAEALSASLPAGPMLELCCGAGHIGLLAAIGAERHLVQIDADPVACEYAVRNAEAAGMRDRVEVRCGEVASQVGPEERFPLVIADPPYLRSAETDRYPADPLLAIDGGEDGLAVARQCVEVIARVLAPNGVALIQLRGRAQVEQMAGELVDGLHIVETRDNGPDRVVALIVRTGAR